MVILYPRHATCTWNGKQYKKILKSIELESWLFLISTADLIVTSFIKGYQGPGES